MVMAQMVCRTASSGPVAAAVTIEAGKRIGALPVQGAAQHYCNRTWTCVQAAPATPSSLPGARRALFPRRSGRVAELLSSRPPPTSGVQIHPGVNTSPAFRALPAPLDSAPAARWPS